MKFERVVVQGPLRSTSQVCEELTGFLERCLTGFGHPGATQVRSVLGPAQPLLRTLTTRRGFPDPAAVSLHVAEVEVLVRVAYDPEVADHLAVPIVKPLAGEDSGPEALVVVHTASDVDPDVRHAAESARRDALRLEVRLVPAPSPVPVEPESDVVPGPAQGCVPDEAGTVLLDPVLADGPVGHDLPEPIVLAPMGQGGGPADGNPDGTRPDFTDGGQYGR
ncbi:hypothetical protein ACUXZZ_23555 [Streptomyces graminifolii]|uniref:hypothetical protein n=1 Tax=Streptomyces TaxID=1883 RepID=UPI0036BEBCDC